MFTVDQKKAKLDQKLLQMDPKAKDCPTRDKFCGQETTLKKKQINTLGNSSNAGAPQRRIYEFGRTTAPFPDQFLRVVFDGVPKSLPQYCS